MGEIREPKQARAVDKKNRIIDAAFKLFCEKGYHKTNTAEIAKEAGVSTGIVYNYFKDKKDIYMAAYLMYTSTFVAPIMQELYALQPPFSLREMVESAMDVFIHQHRLSERAHNEMLAMSYTDEDAGELFRRVNMKAAKEIADFLKNNGLNVPHILEKVIIIRELTELYCHEVIYHRHSELDFRPMRETLINLALAMLSEKYPTAEF